MPTELVKPLYTAEATAVGGRNGHARTSDGSLDVDMRPPVEMGGPGGGTNPEQLFAAGYAACFQSALAVVARRQKVDTGDSTIESRVTIGTIEGGGFGLAVAVEVRIPDVDELTGAPARRERPPGMPVQQRHRGNIEVTLSVV